MPLKRTDIHDALLKKGFELGASHHSFFNYRTTKGLKSSIKTKTSHGTAHKEIADNLVSAMARQCKITNGQFKDLVSCKLSQIDYEKLLISGGHVKQSDTKSGENEGK